jgi:hypothetical protein
MQGKKAELVHMAFTNLYNIAKERVARALHQIYHKYRDEPVPAPAANGDLGLLLNSHSTQ